MFCITLSYLNRVKRVKAFLKSFLPEYFKMYLGNSFIDFAFTDFTLGG